MNPSISKAPKSFNAASNSFLLVKTKLSSASLVYRSFSLGGASFSSSKPLYSDFKSNFLNWSKFGSTGFNLKCQVKTIVSVAEENIRSHKIYHLIIFSCFGYDLEMISCSGWD